MNNFELALRAAALVEELTPVANGLVNALINAFKQDTTIENLCAGAIANFNTVKEEIKQS